MLSKVRIGSHPLHAMLVALPITLYVATFAALIGLGATGDPFWLRVALWANLAGVVTAGVAAIPGAIDLLTVVPKRSVAKRTGQIHAIANVAALALFCVNLYFVADAYGDGRLPNLVAGLLVTGGGVLLTAIAGWFGFEMVQRHHVGVIEQPAARAVNDPNAPAARWMDSQSLPVTDSQVIASDEVSTGRWAREEDDERRPSRH